MDNMVSTVTTLEMLKVWLPCLVSVVTLLVNIGFYMLVQPGLNYKYRKKEELAKVSSELFALLSELVSYQNFSGVPTKIRNYSLKIHLCFKSGTADKEIADGLEKVFQMVRERKELNCDEEINKWNNNFRDECRELRKSIGKICGGL